MARAREHLEAASAELDAAPSMQQALSPYELATNLARTALTTAQEGLLLAEARQDELERSATRACADHKPRRPHDGIRKANLIAAEAAAAEATAASTPSAEVEASSANEAQAEAKAESGSVTEQVENPLIDFESTKKKLTFDECPAESSPEFAATAAAGEAAELAELERLSDLARAEARARAKENAKCVAKVVAMQVAVSDAEERLAQKSARLAEAENGDTTSDEN
eukprot:1652489-Pleurochrysis_carterae.AAC.1